jgi:hypothetical protein
MARRVPDITKIGRYIGYRPTVHLDEIIEHVVDFWGGAAPRTAVHPQELDPAATRRTAVAALAV